MNPLTALRTLAYPALHSDPSQALAESFKPKIIPFSELEQLSPGILPNPIGAPASAATGSENLITGLIKEVSAKQSAAGAAVNGLLGGQNVSLHQTMIAMEEASISLQLMVEVRNKLLESYQELMRMQV